MNLKYIITVVLTAGMVVNLHGQQVKLDTNATLSAKFQNFLAREHWLETNNAAALNSSQLPNIGRTVLSGNQEKGSFYRPQQAKEQHAVNFTSERFLKQNGFAFYGKFSFTQEWEKDVRLTSVLDPYRGNPYILADSIGGNWKNQFYELTLKAAAPALLNDKLIFGIGINYQTGTGARQNDPRPLDYTNQIDLTPSILYLINDKHKFGLNGDFSTFKEKLDITLVNNTNPQLLYKLLGLGEYEHSRADFISLGYSRYYSGKSFGGDLQYEYTGAKLKWLTSVGIKVYDEDVVDGSEMSRKAGKYSYKQYNVMSSLQYAANNWMQQLKFRWSQSDRDGKEFHQFYDSRIETYETIFESVVNTALVTRSSLSYQLLKSKVQKDYDWLVDATVGYSGLDNRYAYPQSWQIVDRMDYSLCAKKNISWSGARSLELMFNVKYYHLLSNKLDYTEKAYSTNYIAKNVLYPDHAYLAAQGWKTGAAVQYGFSLPKLKKTQFFIKGEGNVRLVDKGGLYYTGSANRTSWLLTLGFFN